MSSDVVTCPSAAIEPAARQDAFLTFRSQRVFGSLDGLRAVSILAVMCAHSNIRVPFDLFGKGVLGVDLFFAISGFLITTLLLRERHKRGQISLRNFYIRRSLRIFPLYFTVLAIYCCLVAMTERGTARGLEFWHNLPYYLTYTSNWFIDVSAGHVIFYIAWSLAAEEQFYFVWPSVERWLKGWWPAAAMAVLTVVVLLAKGGMLDGLLPPGSLPWIILRSVALPICLGVILAHLLHEPRTFGVVHACLGWRWCSAAVAAGLLVAVAVPGARSLGWMLVAQGKPLPGCALVVQILMALLVGACVVREDHVLTRLLGNKPMRTLGMISYGVYLMHLAILVGIGHVLHRVGVNSLYVRAGLGYTLVIAAAWFSYHYYEKHFLRMKDRFRGA